MRNEVRTTIRLSAASVALLGCLAWTVPAAAQDGTDFRPTSDYTLQRAGEVLEDAEVFYSPRQVAYLVLASALDRPLIVRIPEEVVVEIPAEAVEVDDLGEIARVDPAEARTVGAFERRREELRFELDGAPTALVPAAPIVGWQTPQTLRSRDAVLRAGFARVRAGAPPVEKAVAVSFEGEVVVEVFFGSWDEYNRRVMPKIMQLEEELSASPVEFRYYGLPRRLADDPMAVERDVHGVPTMIVSRNGAEIGRRAGRSLDEPAESFRRLIAGE